jgi:hypothetical protein
MAAKKTATKRPPKAEYKGYLNVNLSAEDDLQFDAWYGTGAFSLDMLFDVMDLGYKISFSIDDYNDGISVAIYAKSTKLDWAGWTLTAWAGTLHEAAALCFFKHHFVCNQDWNQFTGRPQKSHASRG